MKVFDYIADKYLAHPFICDITISVIIWVTSKNIYLFDFKLFDKSNQVDVISNIINADVSLAGFMLAALTIIVTFKSNLQSKGMDKASNALELIFSSKHYIKIVMVFKESLIELVLCFVLLFFVLASVDNLTIEIINRINVIGITVTALATARSLFILFMILDLEKYKNSED